MNIYKHQIKYYETDKMGVTHHSNYIRFMEEARTDFLCQLGFDYAELEKSGVISPVIGIECKYKATTTSPDVIDIFVSVDKVNGATVSFKYIMKKADGTIAFEGKSQHCFLNKDGRLLRLKKDFPDFYEAMIKLSENA